MAETSDVNLVWHVVVDRNDIHVTVVGEIDATSVAPLQRGVYDVIESTTGAVVVNMSERSRSLTRWASALCSPHNGACPHKVDR